MVSKEMFAIAVSIISEVIISDVKDWYKDSYGEDLTGHIREEVVSVRRNYGNEIALGVAKKVHQAIFGREVAA